MPQRRPRNPVADDRARCPWAERDLDVRYHDREWGVPARGERHFFEMLTLEGAQAGLSWSTILAKREGYRRAFAGFDPERVARFGARDVTRLLGDAGIVRHRGKIEATIANARAVLALRDTNGRLDTWLWGMVEGRPLANAWRSIRQVPAETAASRAMSRELRRAGFRFVGPTICYAFMQAVGMVNDHLVTCFRWREVRRLGGPGGKKGGVGC